MLFFPMDEKIHKKAHRNCVLAQTQLNPTDFVLNSLHRSQQTEKLAFPMSVLSER